jgi:hypothetical protein
MTRRRKPLQPLDLSPGRVVTIEYPAHNRLDLPLEFVERRIRVAEVVRGEAIPATWLSAAPLVRYGTTIIRGEDVDLRRECELWLEAAQGGELPSLKLGLIDPDDAEEATDWIGKPFRPVAVERMRMRDAVNRFMELETTRGPCGMSLVAFPCDRDGKPIEAARGSRDT